MDFIKQLCNCSKTPNTHAILTFFVSSPVLSPAPPLAGLCTLCLKEVLGPRCIMNLTFIAYDDLINVLKQQ